MRISDLVLGLTLAVLSPAAANAFEVKDDAPRGIKPAELLPALPPAGNLGTLNSAPAAVPPVFRSPRDAMRAGLRDYQAGNKAGAAQKLFYAAEQGDVLAQWKLGRMYAAGDGVRHDDLKAFHYFSEIANSSYVGEGPDSPNAAVVSKAFVSLGSYWLEGIPNSPVRANPSRAYEMFSYAATVFQDTDAQYNLGRMHLDGAMGTREPRMAAKWFKGAADRGHVYAQAVLGQMLFNGSKEVPRQAPMGLMWLMVARDGADAKKDAWVHELSEQALSVASEDERRMAELHLSRRARR
jgi:TPR repeat protein